MSRNKADSRIVDPARAKSPMSNILMMRTWDLTCHFTRLILRIQAKNGPQFRSGDLAIFSGSDVLVGDPADLFQAEGAHTALQTGIQNIADAVTEHCGGMVMARPGARPIQGAVYILLRP